MKKSKAEILTEFSWVRGDLLASAASLPEASCDHVFLGSWSIKDLLAHLIGWDHANLEASQAILQKRMPAFYAFIDKDWRSFNEMLVQQYGRREMSDLLVQTSASHQALMDGLQGIPESDFNRDFGVRASGWKVTIARLIEAETGDERGHLEQIRAAFFDLPGLAAWYFNQGFYCSQAVLKTFAPRFGLPDEQAARLAAAFGAGIAYQGETCGAASGALMVLGLRYGNILAQDQVAKDQVKRQAVRFLEQFKSRYQSTFCKDLIGFNVSQPDELAMTREQEVFERFCPQYVRGAVELLLPLLEG